MTEPRLVGARYELDGVVGRGGMAEVYRGHDLRLDRQVAIKALRADLARDPTFQERFRREAQSAASLNHPSIIAVYDTGEDVLNGSTVPYIVMEYAAGRTLRDMLHDDRQLLPERGLEVVGGVLRALEYSHAHGIVHRDIKPANIMVTTSREVKVMDFGIARALHDASATMTQTAQVVGTAQYLSPEQARGERVDARSDVYSTGCVLYEVLTGNPPFRGDSPVAIAYQHVREEPVPPSQVNPDVPDWADPIVLKAMIKDADHRYQSAAEMRADVQRALDGQQVAHPPATSSTQLLGAGNGGTTRAIPAGGDDTMTGRPRRRRRWVAVPLVLLFLAIMALGGFLLTRSLRGAPQVDVPRVVGMEVQAAKKQLSNEGLDWEVRRRFSEQPAGQVFRQSPQQGTVEEGSTIALTVSRGRNTVQVPTDLVGKTQSEAFDAIQQANLIIGETSRKASAEYKEGRVISTSPASGETVPRGSKVDLVISSGVATTAVPKVVGLSVDEAHAKLEGAGFTVTPIGRPTSAQPSGTVLEQSPTAGAELRSGANVTIFVARAAVPSEPETPSSPPTPTPGPTTTVDPPQDDGGDGDIGDIFG